MPQMPDPADDFDARLRRIEEDSANGLAGSDAGPALATVEAHAVIPPAELDALLLEIKNGEPASPSESAQHIEALRARWSEEWASAEAGPVVRRDLAELFEVVNRVSRDSSRVGGQLGTLLGAVHSFRWVGWILLAMALLNLLLLLLGLERMNPESELKTLASLADIAAVPLIGVVMVFWGGAYRRGLWELRLLKGLSWLCLAGAVGYLGAIPLAVQDVNRLHQMQQQRAAQGFERLESGFGEAALALERAADPRALEALAGRILGRPATVAEPDGLEALRAEASGQLARLGQEKRQAVVEQAERADKALWLQGAKMVGESLLAGLVFLLLWRTTTWARRLDVGRTAQKAATKMPSGPA
jgi:hypothetical protein